MAPLTISSVRKSFGAVRESSTSGLPLLQRLRSYLKRPEAYRPERHCIQGPGPANMAKRDRDQVG